MRIVYDNVSKEYLYPLSRGDIKKIKRIIPEEIIGKIDMLRFGCNTKTTQEGRLVQRGSSYEIRVNFCLNNSRSLILSEDKQYINLVKKFGGTIDFKTRFITWKLLEAKLYSLYLFLHEVGHIVYCEKYFDGKLSKKGNPQEEKWCDEWATKAIMTRDEGRAAVTS